MEAVTLATSRIPRRAFDARARQTAARWVASYPCITVVLWLLGPAALPLWASALVATLATVPFVHYVALPMMDRLSRQWIGLPALHGGARHRMAFVIWCCTYPVIAVLLQVLSARLKGSLPLPALALCVTAMAVPLISYVVLPGVLRATGSWVHRES
jgi:antibiotic biosynthesis monooxygenase (ABM) superfamily enzyme